MKQAADAAGRKLCFLGMSLTTYLEAADLEGRAPFDPKELVAPADMDTIDPDKLMIVSTGSQVPSFPLLQIPPSDEAIRIRQTHVRFREEAKPPKVLDSAPQRSKPIAAGTTILHC